VIIKLGERLGLHFKGSDDLLTTFGTTTELITSENKAYKFKFHNLDACTISINEESDIYLIAGDGFESTETDSEIWSFVISTTAVRYTYLYYC
jgi:hypothetical protein